MFLDDRNDLLAGRIHRKTIDKSFHRSIASQILQKYRHSEVASKNLHSQTLNQLQTQTHDHEICKDYIALSRAKHNKIHCSRII